MEICPRRMRERVRPKFQAKEIPMNRILATIALSTVTVAAPAVGVVATQSLQSSPTAKPVQTRLVDNQSPTTATADDRGRSRHVEPGDDKGRHVEPGDDKGRHVEPGDDKGVDPTAEPTPEPGD